MTEDPYLIVFSTLPSQKLAEELSYSLVAKRLVACAQILPAGLSIYTWHDVIESSAETQVIFKTRKSCYAALEQAVLAAHPYEVPEIVAVPVVDGLPTYLNWITATTEGPPAD